MRGSGRVAREYFSSDNRDPGEKSVFSLTVLLLLLMLFFFTSATAWAQPRRFTPTISYYGGTLELELYDEAYKDKFDSRLGQDRSETDIIEKITLAAGGFVYHPRFIIFYGSLTAGFIQGQFEDSFGKNGSWEMTSGLGYDFRMAVLPEHPYNLEIHSLRTAFVNRGIIRAGEGEVPVSQTDGIFFRYRKKPYFADLAYDHTTNESSWTESDANMFRASASHITDWMVTNAAYSHTDTSTSSPGFSGEGNSDFYALTNRIRYKQYRLTSTVDQTTNRQTASRVGFIDTKRFSLEEFLEIDLPWNFNSEFRYRHDTNDTETEDDEDSLSTDYAGAAISHRLFRSLDTRYNLDYTKMTFDASESRRLSQLFSLSYHKQIPWGSMTAGLILGWARSEQDGTALIFHEVHNARLLSDIVLNSADIDDVGAVDVKDPVTGLLVAMPAGDYQVTKIGTITIITILSVPLAVAQPDPFFVYEFLITYTIVQEDQIIEDKSLGFSLDMTLFNGMVSPFYSHTIFREDVVSGSLGTSPNDRTTDTIGVTVRREPFTLRLEYFDSESERDSIKQGRADLFYNQAVSNTLTVFGSANYYEDIHESLADEIRIVTTGAGLGFRKTFTRTNLSITSSFNYARRFGDVEGSGYTFNSYLSWNIRKINILAGATIQHYETESRSASTDHDYHYFYLKAKRQIF